MEVSKEREVLDRWLENAKQNAGLLAAMGVLTVLAGILSLAWPWASGIGVTIVIGVALLVGGVARLVGVFSAGSFGRGVLASIGAALSPLAGVILIVRPGLGLATLTLMLGSFLLVDGIFGAVLSFHVRPEKGWGWILFSAIMGFVLGILLVAEWPLSGVWAIGTLVGVNMLFAGFSMISIGSAVRKLVKGVA